MEEYRGSYTPGLGDFSPRLKTVLFRAGHRGGLAEVDPGISRKAHEAFERGGLLARPSVAWVFMESGDFPPDAADSEVSACPVILAWVCTLGIGLDRAVAGDFDAGRPFEAALLDAWGSEAVDTLAARFEALARSPCGAMTPRRSPGYGGIPAAANVAILAAIGARNVSADPRSGMLTPGKSVVCVLGCARGAGRLPPPETG